MAEPSIAAASAAVVRRRLSPAQVLADAETLNLELGHDNLGSLSVLSGFVPTRPPRHTLPTSHAAWDDAARRLPALYRHTNVRAALDQLPLLSASAEALPDVALLRAATVLGVLAHAYAYASPTPMGNLPGAIAQPWLEVRRRLGRTDDLTLSYADLIVNNWQEAEPPDGVRLSVGHRRLLVPSIDNTEEQVFYLTQLDVLLRCAPVVGAIARAVDAVRDHDGDVLAAALHTIDGALAGANSRALPLIDPRPVSRTYVNPVIWAKTVAPFAVPLQPGVLGPSGTASPIFNLLDAFLGRATHDSALGREILAHRRSYPPHWRHFIDAVDASPIADHLRAGGNRRLHEQFAALQERYVGPGGFLDRHRRKVYGYLSIAFKVGRGLTIGGFAGQPQQRTWDVVDRALVDSQRERPAPKPARAGRPGSGVQRISHTAGRGVGVAELAVHNDPRRGLWLAVHGRVYDVSDFRRKHPGGPHVLHAYAGLDASRTFDRAHTDRAAPGLLRRFDIGFLRHPAAPTPIYRAWVDAVFTIVEMQNNLRLDRLPDQVAGASTEEPTAANPLARAMNDNTSLRYREHYLPWLRTHLQASLGLGLDALPFSDVAEVAGGRPGPSDIGDELAAIKARVLQLGS
jgi:hypothetical protein